MQILLAAFAKRSADEGQRVSTVGASGSSDVGALASLILRSVLIAVVSQALLESIKRAATKRSIWPALVGEELIQADQKGSKAQGRPKPTCIKPHKDRRRYRGGEQHHAHKYQD